MGRPWVSKPCVPEGILPSGRPLQVVGAGRISALIQFNFVKCGSFSVGGFASGTRLTWTLDRPETPTWA